MSLGRVAALWRYPVKSMLGEACAAGDWPEVEFPDGRRLRGEDPAIHDALSAALGVPVKLAREGNVPHFDSEPIHLVTTAALEWLRSRLPGGVVDERRFRPNIVVAVPGRSQLELAWIGREVRIGEATLRVTASTERCRMTALAQADLPSDAGVLRCIAQEAGLQFGVYAEVLEPGRVAAGDAVALG
jgi:uncharacterized protein YcbX